MDYLCSQTSSADWLNNVIIPLSLFGYGSIDSILNLKVPEIKGLMLSLKDEQTIKLRRYYNFQPIE